MAEPRNLAFPPYRKVRSADGRRNFPSDDEPGSEWSRVPLLCANSGKAAEDYHLQVAAAAALRRVTMAIREELSGSGLGMHSI